MTQLALFDPAPAEMAAITLPIARLNPTNQAVMHTQDCYYETVQDHNHWRIEIAIGRSAQGYHAAPSHATGWSGNLSPVFIRTTAHANFATAHYAAWQSLIERAIKAQFGIKPGKQEWPQQQAA